MRPPVVNFLNLSFGLMVVDALIVVMISHIVFGRRVYRRAHMSAPGVENGSE